MQDPNSERGPRSSAGLQSHHSSRVLTILVKEFREIFRDRRTVISVVISPLLITPAIFAVLGLFIGSESRKEAARVYDVGIVSSGSSHELSDEIANIPQLSVRPVDRSQAESEISAKRLAAVVIVPDNASRLLTKDSPVPIEVLIDAGDQSSQSASARLVSGMKSIGEHVVASRLKSVNLPDDFAQPFKLNQRPIKGGGSVASLLLASMLPYLLVISSFGGAIYASFDQVAGEKERGTLETLLVSPASRREIVLGKFCAVAAVCIISSILSVAGIIISFSFHSSALSALTTGGLHLSAAAIGVSLFLMIPIAVLFAGVLLGVSTFARNQKEAQTYITPILLLVIMPALFSVVMRTDVPLATSLVPILGTSIIIKQAFGGVFNLAFIALAFGSSLVYGWVAVLVTTKMFENESVLIKA